MRAKLVLLLGFLLLFFLPSQLGYHFWPSWSVLNTVRIDYLSPTLLFTDILGFLFILFSLPLPFSKHAFWYLLPLFNIIFSPFPQVSLFHWLRLIFYFYIFFSFQKFLPLYKKYWLSALTLSLFWSVSLAMMQFIKSTSLGGFWYWLGERPLSVSLPYIAKVSLVGHGIFLRPYATFPHPNALAGYLLFSLFLIYQFAARSLMKTFVYIVSVLGILISFSRIAAFLLLSLFSVIIQSSFFKKIFLITPLIFLPIFINSYISNPLPLTERLELLQNSFIVIQKHPLTGVGLGAFPAAAISLPSSNLQLSYQPVHNLFLLLISELGLPAFTFILFILIKNLNRSMFLKHWVLITVFFITASLDHYWITSNSNLLLLLFALALTCPSVAPINSKAERRRIKSSHAPSSNSH